jgi:hypothetical protein
MFRNSGIFSVLAIIGSPAWHSDSEVKQPRIQR